MRKRDRRQKKRVTWEDCVSVCAWCGKQIPADSGAFVLGAELRPGVEVGPGGNVLGLTMGATRALYAIVTAEDSEARKNGVGFIFTACSSECAEALQEQVLIRDMSSLVG